MASVTKVQGDPSRAGLSFNSRFSQSLNFGYFKENKLTLNAFTLAKVNFKFGKFHVVGLGGLG